MADLQHFIEGSPVNYSKDGQDTVEVEEVNEEVHDSPVELDHHHHHRLGKCCGKWSLLLYIN